MKELDVLSLFLKISYIYRKKKLKKINDEKLRSCKIIFNTDYFEDDNLKLNC